MQRTERSSQGIAGSKFVKRENERAEGVRGQWQERIERGFGKKKEKLREVGYHGGI